MRRPSGFLLLVFIIGLLGFAGMSVLKGRSLGAGVGYSGGPSGYNFGVGNCTGCHEFSPPENPGSGSVRIVDAPRRYRAGATYDLGVRISDTDQVGAGFEISAESASGHRGQFIISDPANTQNAESFPPVNYVTHTMDGYRDSIDQWTANGDGHEYRTRWAAPAGDEGRVTLFAAGNAVNDANASDGDHYYATYVTLPFAEPGDADGDTDADLRDVALFQRCFGDGSPFDDPSCREVDFLSDSIVSLVDLKELADAMVSSGPTATLPAGYVPADAVRGGQLYDRWWTVTGAPEPLGTHPLYPPIGQQSGSATFRCKECHGWDYQGVNGAYGSGSHFTGIPGVFGTTRSPQAIFDLLKADPDVTPNGHDMDAFGLTDGDLWDVVKMTLEGVIDTDVYINTGSAEVFLSSHNIFLGNFWYDTMCASCHDDPFDTDPVTHLQRKGTRFNFATPADPEYIGTVANANPWEFLHKMRFGHPGTPMPMLDLLGWSVDQTAAIGKFSVTLPTE